VSITIHPEFESKLRALAGAEGISVEQYLERLIQAEQDADEKLQALAIEGLNSGEPIEIGPEYWEAKHRRLDERLRNSSH
jgi:antitoxin ParD1/3/4